MNPCTIIFGKNNQINSFSYLLIDLIIDMDRMDQTRPNQIEMSLDTALMWLKKRVLITNDMLQLLDII